QVGHKHGCLRLLRRHVQQLRNRAERRLSSPYRHLRAGLSATAGVGYLRRATTPEEGAGRGFRRAGNGVTDDRRLVALVTIPGAEQRPTAAVARPPRLPAPMTAAIAALVELGGVHTTAHDLHHVTIQKYHLLDGLRKVRELGLEMLTDIHGMDYLTYPGHRGKRFAVIYNVHDVAGTSRLFIRVELDDGES